MYLSIVTTLFNSVSHLEEFHRRMSAAAERITDDYEMILVNDGSPDDSLELAISLYEKDEKVRLIDLSRNFGHHKAIMTGLAHARGSLVFLIDCDLEEEPELLAEFYQTMKSSGADVVYGVQERRKGNGFEQISGAVFYKLINLLSSHPIPENLITARLMSKRYVMNLTDHMDREIFLAGLWVITGFKQIPIAVNKHSKGSSTYNFVHKVDIIVNSITSFSTRPLVFIFYLGLVIVCLSSIAAAALIIRRVFFGSLLAGWPSLIVSIWLLGGLILFCLGIIGIYLSKIFMETKRRPYTITRHLYERAAKDAYDPQQDLPKRGAMPFEEDRDAFPR